jgi:phosphoribosylaminoimidazole (AIR) synthetase
MKELLQRITKLIDVKSIMTLTLTIVFAVLVLRGNVTNEQYMTIFTMIVGFYFGVQSAKNG